MWEVNLCDESVSVRSRLSEVSRFRMDHVTLAVWIQNLQRGRKCVCDTEKQVIQPAFISRANKPVVKGLFIYLFKVLIQYWCAHIYTRGNASLSLPQHCKRWGTKSTLSWSWNDASNSLSWINPISIFQSCSLFDTKFKKIYKNILQLASSYKWLLKIIIYVFAHQTDLHFHSVLRVLNVLQRCIDV